MAKKKAKKKKKKSTPTQRRESRIARAQNWLPTYKGTKIVKAYRDKFNVDTNCAVRELQQIGYEFEPGYVENLLSAEALRIEQRKKKKEEKRLNDEYWNDSQDDMFYFIAGYTSGGAPYGVTWDEMGLEPYENEFYDEEITSCRHYDFLSQHEKDSINNKLREDFSQYVTEYRRMPSKGKQKQLIEKVFDNYAGGALYYDKSFNSTYRKIVRKKENAFIREGVLPKRFSPTEVKKIFEQSVMLESERLIFRKITENDFDDLAEMLRDPEVMYAWEHTFTDEQIHKWIDNQITRYRDHIVGYFAVISKETEEFIGQMGLMWSDFDGLRALELGYMLKRKFWGNGYAVEGAEALMQYGFSEIGINKVYASIRSCNEKSIKVAESIGMSAEGSFFKQYNGESMEHIIYSKDRNCEQEN